MILGVSNYSYFKHMGKTGETNFDIFAKAKTTGFKFMDLLDLSPRDGQNIEDCAKETVEKLNENGLEMGAYTVWGDFLRTTPDDELIRLKKQVDTAAMLGAKKMRHDVAWSGQNYKETVIRLAPYIRELSKYAEQKGVATMTENHGYFLQESSRMEFLVNTVAFDNYGLLIDMGNFMCANEAPEHAVSVLAQYAKHVHVKDFLYKSGDITKPAGPFFETSEGNYIRGTIAGHGIVPIKRCLGILKKSGYDGGIAYEFEGPEENLDAISDGFANITAALSAI